MYPSSPESPGPSWSSLKRNAFPFESNSRKYESKPSGDTSSRSIPHLSPALAKKRNMSTSVLIFGLLSPISDRRRSDVCPGDGNSELEIETASLISSFGSPANSIRRGSRSSEARPTICGSWTFVRPRRKFSRRLFDFRIRLTRSSQPDVNMMTPCPFTQAIARGRLCRLVLP